VVHDGHQGQPGLAGGRDDLIGRQDEAVAAGVPELKGVGVPDAVVVGPVDGAAARLVCGDIQRVMSRNTFYVDIYINKNVYIYIYTFLGQPTFWIIAAKIKTLLFFLSRNKIKILIY